MGIKPTQLMWQLGWLALLSSIKILPTIAQSKNVSPDNLPPPQDVQPIPDSEKFPQSPPSTLPPPIGVFR